MEQLTHFVLQNFVSPLLLVCFMIIVLFAMGGSDGMPIVKAIISSLADSLKLVTNALIKLASWSLRKIVPQLLKGLIVTARWLALKMEQLLKQL